MAFRQGRRLTQPLLSCALRNRINVQARPWQLSFVRNYDPNEKMDARELEAKFKQNQEQKQEKEEKEQKQNRKDYMLAVFYTATTVIGYEVGKMWWYAEEFRTNRRFAKFWQQHLKNKPSHDFAPKNEMPFQERPVSRQHVIGNFEANPEVVNAEHIIGMRLMLLKDSQKLKESNGIKVVGRDYLVYWGQREGKNIEQKVAEFFRVQSDIPAPKRSFVADCSWVDAKLVNCPAAEAEFFATLQKRRVRRALQCVDSRHGHEMATEEIMVGPFAKGKYKIDAAGKCDQDIPAWVLPAIVPSREICRRYSPKNDSDGDGSGGGEVKNGSWW